MSGPSRSMPTVSVIMPARDARETIDEAIESLVGQSLNDWELLVVDDGSRDATRANASAWAHRDDRIHVLQGAGRGPGAARNLAMNVARGVYIHFLDADDLLRADALATLVAAAAQSAPMGVFGAYERINPKGRPLDWVCSESLNEVGLNDLLERNRFPVHAQLIRRDVIGDARFNESLQAVEDWDLWLRLAMRGVRWRRVDCVVADYRQGLATRSGRFGEVARATHAMLRDAYAGARACGVPCDASSDRRRRVEWAHALEIATQAAVADVGGAIDIMRGAVLSAGAGGPSAHDAAQAAYWLAPTSRGGGPQEWRCEDGFAACATGVLRFWRALEREAIVPIDFHLQALDELASLLTPREAIAQDMLAQCAGATSVTLIGYGANGRFLAEALRARNVNVAIFDDGVAARGAIQISGPVIVTPLDDRDIVTRLPPSAAPIRWSESRRRLSAQWRDRLRALLMNDFPNSRRGAA